MDKIFLTIFSPFSIQESERKIDSIESKKKNYDAIHSIRSEWILDQIAQSFDFLIFERNFGTFCNVDFFFNSPDGFFLTFENIEFQQFEFRFVCLNSISFFSTVLPFVC